MDDKLKALFEDQEPFKRDPNLPMVCTCDTPGEGACSGIHWEADSAAEES